jgi:hypothetical protein
VRREDFRLATKRPFFRRSTTSARINCKASGFGTERRSLFLWCLFVLKQILDFKKRHHLLFYTSEQIGGLWVKTDSYCLWYITYIFKDFPILSVTFLLELPFTGLLCKYSQAMAIFQSLYNPNLVLNQALLN